MKKLLLLFFIFISIIGCSTETPEGLPSLSPCKITVIQDGQPLPGASVIFLAADNSVSTKGKTWTPMGLTDEKGVAVMRTNARYEGVPLGKYKILINKTEQEQSKLGQTPPENSPAYATWITKSQDEKLYEYGLVEPIYNNAEKTPYEIEIGKSANAKSVDVGKAVRVKLLL
jgi:hypothetical protein